MGALDEWRFCPRCGERIDKADGHAACAACGYMAYANPVPGAEVVIVDERGRVLLGRRAFDPAAGLWDLPGGFLNEDEDPLEALRREVREETGLELEAPEFVAFFLEPYERRTVLAMTWRARRGAGEERAGDDLSELRWFAPDDIPQDELAFSHYPQALSDALRHANA